MTAKTVDQATLADLWRLVPPDEDFWSDTRDRMRTMLKHFMQAAWRRRWCRCFACPIQDRRKGRTTNAIERCFREVRRGTRPMTCFTNDAGCERIIYAVFAHLNRRWEGVMSRQVV